METALHSIKLPAFKTFEGDLRVPGSKSISNRALLMAALARGTTKIRHSLGSDDTQHMARALEGLGVELKAEDPETELEITGEAGPFKAGYGTFFLGNSGTAMRSLTAALCLGHGEFELLGEQRMYERPIGDLLGALRELGAKIDCERREGFPPLKIHASGLAGPSVSVRGDISSQYLTALLLCAPYVKGGLDIKVEGELISKPYIELTLSMMRDFGVEVGRDGFSEFKVPGGVYESPGIYEIEGDASSASYPLAAAAISGGKVIVRGIGKGSVQGDLHFAEVLEEMGAEVHYGGDWVSCKGGGLKAVDLNLNHIPDAAMTVAVLALFAKGTSRISGIKSWKVKETDRLAALKNELQKTGAIVTTTGDSIEITPPKKLRPATIETYNDHRMAMCFSLLSVGGVPVEILDPACVGKTYPTYFEDFLRLAK